MVCRELGFSPDGAAYTFCVMYYDAPAISTDALSSYEYFYDWPNFHYFLTPRFCNGSEQNFSSCPMTDKVGSCDINIALVAYCVGK